MAYFTDAESKTNTITVSSFDTTLTEPEWDKVPDNIKNNVTPNQTIAKDPTVTNVGKTSAFVFADVTVPTRNVIVAEQNGVKKPAALTEMFSYTLNTGWTLVGTMQEVKDANGTTVIGHKYTYVWGSSEKCTELAPTEKTSPVFNHIKTANIIEGQGVENEKLSVQVDEKAIQISDLGENSTTVPSEVLSILLNQR